jgi:hypothetical protein
MPPRASRHGLLTPLQEAALEALFGLRGSEAFALFGGTALAEFYAGHRVSDDLDLFTFERDAVRPFAQTARLALGERVGAPGPLRQGISAEFYQQLFIDHPALGSLKLDIGLADPPQLGSFAQVGAIRVADFMDLVAAKAGALADRGLPRDGVDLWWIVEHGGVELTEVERLLFSKDQGLADYPQAWADGLWRAARAPDSAWEAAGSMLQVREDAGRVRAFLEAAFQKVTARLADTLKP